ncbi:MAG: hypothetical protein ACE5KH_06070, partial [Candidatus Geothermarchaeales archaeon]
IPSADYSALVAVPSEFQAEYRNFLERLVESGLLQGYESYGLDWFRLRSLDENDYNFRRGRWEVDWKARYQRPVHIEEPPTESKSLFRADRLDLLILKELGLDGTQRLSQMARKLNLTYRAVYYHYIEHLIGQGLIGKYSVYPTAARDEPWTLVLHLLHGLTIDETVQAENLFHRVPFTWMDGYGRKEGLYAAFTALPTTETTNMFEFISERILDLRRKYSFELVSLAHSKRYTVPYEMMEEDGVWGFEPRQALKEVVVEPPRQSLNLKK